MCDKEFETRSGLKSHKEQHHSDAYYKCEICEKQFKQKLILNRHRRSHTDKKAFKCEVCGKGFPLNLWEVFQIPKN